MNELKWTAHKPTKEGAYFYRAPNNAVQLAQVFWASGKNKELRARRTGTTLEYPVSALSGQWAGPIPGPTGFEQ